MRDTKRYQLHFYVHLEQASNADNTLKALRAFINSNILVFVWRPRFYLGTLRESLPLLKLFTFFHFILSYHARLHTSSKINCTCIQGVVFLFWNRLRKHFYFKSLCMYIGIIWKDLRLNGMTNRFKVLIFFFSNILSWLRVIINNKKTKKNEQYSVTLSIACCSVLKYSFLCSN